MVQREDMLEILRSRLKSEPKARRCGTYIYHLDSIERLAIYQELESQRLLNKHATMSSQHDDEHMSWNHIAYMNLMRYMGNMDNRRNYVEIARRLSFETLQRERASVENLEALLIGTAGLLSTLPKDDFSRGFVDNGNYMLHKHKITPLKRGQWSGRGVSFCKAPIIRLSQIAHILYNHEYLFNHILSCKCRNDIFDICNVSASKGISKYFGAATRNVGAMVCDIVGINTIVPLQYTYGIYSDDDEMIHQANRLNEQLPAERNDIIKAWCNSGLAPTSAYETQALIELNNNFCKEGQCHRCVIYRHICSDSNILDKIPVFCSR